MRNKDNELNRFRKTINRGKYLDKFQDPTYLGFKIFFMNLGGAIGPVNGTKNNSKSLLDSKLNSAKDRLEKLKTKKQDIENSLKSEEGVKGTFNNQFKKLPEGDFLSGLPNSEGLFGNENNPNSALYFLRKIGDYARYNMLKDFIKLLIEINTKYDYYFQEIEGLDEAWKRDYNKPRFIKEITINCLESIDLRITGLMDLYRKIAYDWENRRIVLPDNLRTFDMSIKIFDIRNFQKNPHNEKFFGVEKYSETTQLNFDLKWCQFIPDGSSEFLSSLSNNPSEPNSQKIKISYEKIEESAIYRILESLGNNDFYIVKDYLKSELDLIGYNGIDINESYISNFLSQRVLSVGNNLVRNAINSRFLGNVYNVSPSSLLNNPEGGIRNVANNIIDKFNNKNNSGDLDNIYGK